MNGTKKILNKITIGVLIFLVVCTFLSKSIASSFLPEVEVTRAFTMDLTVSGDYTGEVLYDLIYESVYDFPVKVTNVSVYNGGAVKEGDVLFEVENTEYYLEMKRRELNILKVKNMMAQTFDDDLIAEFTLQLEIEEKELSLYREKYPTDGKIYAKISGIVYDLAVQTGETVSPGTVLTGIYDNNSGSNVIFYLSETDAKKYAVQDEVALYYKENGKSTTNETTVRKKEYDTITETYKYFARIKSESVRNNQKIPLTITHRTKIYDMVIPYSSVISGGENKNYVYVAKEREGLFGAEYYAKLTEVEIIDNNSMHAALKGWVVTPSDDVIISSSKSLTSGETVKVIEK